jgi:DNA helicase-2/ATP-dependent DNA helicase PcrA
MAIEEERRLCYVGMTRAKKRLFLCSTIYRYMWGTAKFMRPSRFLKEIPKEYLDNFSLPSLHTSQDAIEEPTEGFAIGDQVQHKEFGVGIIQKSYQGSFGLTYEVHFPDSETNRTLVAKYAKLEAYPL